MKYYIYRFADCWLCRIRCVNALFRFVLWESVEKVVNQRLHLQYKAATNKSEFVVDGGGQTSFRTLTPGLCVPGRVHSGQFVYVRVRLTHYSLIKTNKVLSAPGAEPMTVLLWFCVNHQNNTKENAAMLFQILSLHRVNKLRVKQCSHRCQSATVNDVDTGVRSSRACARKAGNNKLSPHKNSYSIITVST